ncbi:riboflavin biosynthesis protein RibF [Acinetobacter indicus]|jgi:riboflavin kinase/FMN adenylyltransferase|uniref:Riboflavin biosynthesis protein n=1 Tax=Acinetobacter indicus CIP 110367 TaxID=1341679 RepID=V2VJF3_9GAMM|nr:MULTISPECIES: riboflavin biosynthesis protein RibF [Acinetobacter]EPF73386.1 riboflavin biosynthesis protein RibF [Acinetobacter indicus ANC 4215]ESK47694.1 riboflavin biosynthesis protein RibF [Acinetobacter indicus CIP 110367]MCO8108072.1 riboflavin biosynthesis protein RibF [Acinetobacter indicus]MCP0915115.1 riboflavin biosynthesis protein RibF [Acinetobacter indicus]MCP0918240.1 riboflavin biosynthesis protein RibF [Acinetobacter indicus]
MQLLRLNALAPDFQLEKTAVTIGNFDGVHLGHQAMIAQLKQLAAAQQLKTLVMIFEPQPLEFFKGYEAPPRISSLREKVEYLTELGVDYIAVAKFDNYFRSLSAEAFADILKYKLNAHSLVLGDDFHFGKNRQGNSEFLQQYGFQVTNLNTILADGERVSSTRIRQTLQAGNLALAAKLLGRPYSITGRVQYGDQIGRTIDFPTINVRLNRHKPCLNGIYGVEVLCETESLQAKVQAENPNQPGIAGYDPTALFGAGHVGTRPAIKQDHPEWRLEVHFPEVSANLYGLLMRVTFLNYLHGEKDYPSLEALKAGIDDDVEKLLEFRRSTPKFPFE